MHSLWSPSIAQALPGEIKGAMIMTDVEGNSLLGDGSFKAARGAISFSDDIPTEGYSEPMETNIRNWLKGIRDSGYVIILKFCLESAIWKCIFFFFFDFYATYPN